MKLKILVEGVFHGSQQLEVGSVISIDDASGSSLVESGHAECTLAEDDEDEDGKEKEPNTPVTPQNGQEGTQTPEGDTNTDEGETGAEIDSQSATDNNTDLELARKALDSQYKRDEIYEAAVKAGVEIAYNAKKSDIIEAVIAQGKETTLIK